MNGHIIHQDHGSHWQDREYPGLELQEQL
jgi:hypothetical protein